MQSKPTILLVDDNAPFRMLMRAYLHKAGYDVMEAEHGIAAMEKLANPQPALLLLDLQMQPLGGFDFMTQYTERGFKMPVVLVTGDESSDILTRSTKLGFAGLLKKPVAEERLLQIVKRFAPMPEQVTF